MLTATSKPKNIKVMTILGTRPEIIRLSRVLPKLDEYVSHRIVYTGQNYDFELSEIFFKELELRRPDYMLKAKSDTLGGQIANILRQSEEVMIKEKPDVLLILGDTNSSLSAIIAKRLKITIFHMEAGNRSFDDNVPEEINRRIIDHISDVNLPYTEHSRRYLIREGIHPGNIYVTGSPLPEVFHYFSNKISSSSILTRLAIKPQHYFLLSVHREENIDNDHHLQELFSSLHHIIGIYHMPIIVSLHPRTKKRLEKLAIPDNPLIQFHQPFGYFDYIKLQKESFCVLSDSGTIQEEASLLGMPAIQVRVSSERPEGFEAGVVILSGFHKDTLVSAIQLAVEDRNKGIVFTVPDNYRDINVSSKVVRLVIGLASIKKYHTPWW